MWTFNGAVVDAPERQLNVFLGVRNLNEEALPDHLQFLKSFLTKRPIGWCFPISVTLSTVVAALLFEKAFAAEAGSFTQTA